MFKRNILLFCLTTGYLVCWSFCFMNVPSIQNFDTVAFDESIFKAYNSSSMMSKSVKTRPATSSEIEKDSGIEATSGARDVHILKTKPIPKKTKNNPLEKLLKVAMTGEGFEDARKLVRLKCSNSMIRSYIDIDEEYPSYTHPRIADFEMVDICQNNKTSCCNKQETLKIRTIFQDRQNQVRQVMKKFRKILQKLGKFIFAFNP